MPVKTHHLSRRLVFGLALAAAGALGASEPLVTGLGSHTRQITTQSAEAQRYFDQGLNYYFGFHHGAAVRSFKEAARIDPACAMAHWGIALANGPHINLTQVPPAAADEPWG
jgi:hypothetical protein